MTDYQAQTTLRLFLQSALIRSTETSPTWYEVLGTEKAPKELTAEDRKQKTINTKVPFDKCHMYYCDLGQKPQLAPPRPSNFPE